MKSVKPLSREIRKLARKRLRAKKSVWKEYKRLRRTWRTRLRRQTSSVGIIYLFASAFVILKNGQNASAMLLLSTYSLATSIGRAATFSDVLYRSGNLAYFMHTPASDREFFEYKWRATLRSSAIGLGLFAMRVRFCGDFTGTRRYGVCGGCRSRDVAVVADSQRCRGADSSTAQSMGAHRRHILLCRGVRVRFSTRCLRSGRRTSCSYLPVRGCLSYLKTRSSPAFLDRSIS